MPRTERRRIANQRNGRLLWVAGLAIGVLGGCTVAFALSSLLSSA
jgi:hypothetical protein